MVFHFIKTAIVIRGCFITFLVLSLTSLTGCIGVAFDRDFNSVVGRPAQTHDSLDGAWNGTWQSRNELGEHQARAIIDATAPSTYTIRLEMVGFEPAPGANFPFNKYWIELQKISLPEHSSSPRHFNAKIRLEKAYRASLVSEAMTLNGDVDGKSLRIKFQTNDALRALDEGSIELRREN